MAQSPRVSVCLPVFNGEPYLGAALGSILRQSFTDFELIAVDDGSTDRSVDILSACKDPRLAVFARDRTSGIPTCWNEALALARGEFVTVFHQDDLMHPDNLARKVACLDANPDVGWVHSRVEALVEEAPHPFTTGWMESSQTDFVLSGDQYFLRLILRGNLVCAPTVLLRRETLRETGAFDPSLHFACDYDLWLRLCLAGGAAYLADPLVGYRWHRKNASHGFMDGTGHSEMAAVRRAALRQYRRRTTSVDVGVLEEALDVIDAAYETIWHERASRTTR